ncbi:MAG: hypothetical protein KDC14_16665, partial [Planctomycetes bacterium]|nr:hypothetical protein [Planctomycetota bacterium]
TPASRLRAALVAALALGAASCGREARDWTEVRRRAAGLELRIEAPDPDLAALAERATRGCSSGGRLIAAGFDDAIAGPWLERLGVGHTADGLRLAGHDFDGADDLLIACFEDPEHAGAPVALYLGDAEIVRAWVAEARPLSRHPSLRLVLDRETEFTARLARDGSLEEHAREAVGAARTALRREFTRHPLGDDLLRSDSIHQLRVVLGPGVEARRADTYLQECVATLERAHAWCGAGPTPMHLDLLGRADDYAQLGGLDELGTVDPTGHVAAALLVPGLPHDAGAALARGVARQQWGPPVDARTELALGIAASGAVWGRALEEWPREGGSSPLASAAALAQHFVQLAGAGDFDGLRALWTGVRTAEPGATTSELAPLAARFGALPELRGIVVEPPTVPLLSSAPLALDVDLAGNYGANALSISLTFTAQESLPERIGERGTARGRSRQGDALLAALLVRARDAGLAHLALRPRLLDSDSGQESARRKRTTADEWTEFFDEYAATIEHSALLAELLRADVLCVGEGLWDATRTELEDRTGLPQEVLDVKRDGWRRLAQVARTRFAGRVAYLADWPKEAGRLAFWDAFDLYTFAWFPALSAGGPDDVDARDLKRLLYGQLSLMDRFAEESGKPYVVLATGLPASEFAWRDATLASGAPDEAEQARLYAGLAGALENASERLARFGGIALTGFGAGAEADPRGDRAVGRAAEADVKRILAGGRDAE